ncbi:MAG: hypothetical protein EHJ94_08005 [Deltaproteobacteria bacterium]|nr:MAG: hypothetical protein EHJ94_08005 [Deltaproteobacteria bacterium]
MDIQQMMAHLKNVAGQVNLLLNDPKRAYNTRLAQEVGKWAGAHGKGDEFHNAIFRAYFVDSKNISDPLILINLTESIGLSKDDARKVIDNRTFKDAVDKDWSRSREVFISSVPTFLINEQRLVGAQSYETLKQFMVNNKVKKPGLRS